MAQTKNTLKSTTNHHDHTTTESVSYLDSSTCFKLTITIGLLFRLVLFFFTDISKLLSNRVEIVTPATSYKSLSEGIFLFQNHLSPYDGNLMHQSPLLLAFFNLLNPISASENILIKFLFSIIDILNAILIANICTSKNLDYSKRRNFLNESYPIPWISVTFYLFNPFTIMTSIGMSTVVITNFFILASISAAYKNRVDYSMLSLAIASSLALHPIFLLPPILLILKSPCQTQKSLTFKSLTIFMFDFIALQGLSYIISGSWNYILETYGFLLLVPDLTPNIGLFWYFFIETFDAFRLFFLVVFQLHLIIYLAPMCIKLKEHPLFVIFIICGITSIFKSYPCIGDTSLYLAFLPIYSEIVKYMRYTFLTVNLFAYASCLGPVFYHLWIYAGSGNANFFYAITLVFALAQCILLGDAMFAILRRDVDLALSLDDQKEHIVLVQ